MLSNTKVIEIVRMEPSRKTITLSWSKAISSHVEALGRERFRYLVNFINFPVLWVLFHCEYYHYILQHLFIYFHTLGKKVS